MHYEKELSCALRAVHAASCLCRTVQKRSARVESVQKKDKSPVTLADLSSQAVISLEISRCFADDPIVGEEEADILRDNPNLNEQVISCVNEQIDGQADERTIHDMISLGRQKIDFSGRYWTVDPIDGTKGFLRGEQYAVALALVEGGAVKVAALGCPNYTCPAVGEDGVSGVIFYAVSGSGTRVRPIDTDSSYAVTADSNTDPARARFCESVESGHASHEDHARISGYLGIEQPPYRIDSQAKYGAVACGEASIYLRLPRSSSYREKIWDHAAGALIVEEAGGRVTDFSGSALDFSRGERLEENVGILATNGLVHGAALEAIARAL